MKRRVNTRPVLRWACVLTGACLLMSGCSGGVSPSDASSGATSARAATRPVPLAVNLPAAEQRQRQMGDDFVAFVDPSGVIVGVGFSHAVHADPDKREEWFYMDDVYTDWWELLTDTIPVRISGLSIWKASKHTSGAPDHDQNLLAALASSCLGADLIGYHPGPFDCTYGPSTISATYCNTTHTAAVRQTYVSYTPTSNPGTSLSAWDLTSWDVGFAFDYVQTTGRQAVTAARVKGTQFQFLGSHSNSASQHFPFSTSIGCFEEHTQYANLWSKTPSTLHSQLEPLFSGTDHTHHNVPGSFAVDDSLSCSYSFVDSKWTCSGASLAVASEQDAYPPSACDSGFHGGTPDCIDEDGSYFGPSVVVVNGECSGVWIHPNYVLTAAHCVMSEWRPARFVEEGERNPGLVGRSWLGRRRFTRRLLRAGYPDFRCPVAALSECPAGYEETQFESCPVDANVSVEWAAWPEMYRSPLPREPLSDSGTATVMPGYQACRAPRTDAVVAWQHDLALVRVDSLAESVASVLGTEQVPCGLLAALPVAGELNGEATRVVGYGADGELTDSREGFGVRRYLDLLEPPYGSEVRTIPAGDHFNLDWLSATRAGDSGAPVFGRLGDLVAGTQSEVLGTVANTAGLGTQFQSLLPGTSARNWVDGVLAGQSNTCLENVNGTRQP